MVSSRLEPLKRFNFGKIRKKGKKKNLRSPIKFTDKFLRRFLRRSSCDDLAIFDIGLIIYRLQSAKKLILCALNNLLDPASSYDLELKEKRRAMITWQL